MTERDREKLAELTPDTRERVERFLELAAERGHPVTIVEAHRGADRQARLAKKGLSLTVKSWHRCGRAVDVMFLRPDGRRSYNGPWSILGAIGEEAGLEWGGRWRTLRDQGHFQFRGSPEVTWELALAIYERSRNG